jgi:tetratricopeptide (TPR) repeat protein
LRRFDQGDLLEAGTHAQTALPSYPDDGALWQIYGLACVQRREFAAGRAALEQATCLQPLSMAARLALALAYAHTGRTQLARHLYQQLRRNRDCAPALWPKLAAGLGAIGANRAALAVCRRLARLQPGHHAAHYGVAFYRARLGLPARCLLRPLCQAHRLAPFVAIYRLNLAAVYDELEQLPQAYPLLQGVLPETVSCPRWLARLADWFERLGDESRAKACHRRRATLRRG